MNISQPDRDKKLSKESQANFCQSVFYSCLNSSKPVCCSIHREGSEASGGVVFHRPVWYACAARPTRTHLMAGWLAFLHSLCNYGSSPGLPGSAPPAPPYSYRAGFASAKQATHFPPGHLAQPLILTITRHRGKMCTDNSSRRQLPAGQIVSITLWCHVSGFIMMFFTLG